MKNFLRKWAKKEVRYDKQVDISPPGLIRKIQLSKREKGRIFKQCGLTHNDVYREEPLTYGDLLKEKDFKKFVLEYMVVLMSEIIRFNKK